MSNDPRVQADLIHQMSWRSYIAMADALAEIDDKRRAMPWWRRLISAIIG